MNRFRHILLVIVMVNALLALFLWLTETRMPGWFAAVLALASLALVCGGLAVLASSRLWFRSRC